MRNFFKALTASVLAVALLSGCGAKGDDWQAASYQPPESEDALCASRKTLARRRRASA